MSTSLVGKSAVVTGGLRGIGRATAECLREQGARVVVVDLDVPTSSQSGDVVQADVTNAQAIGNAVVAAAEPAGLDICVANAGITGFRSVLEATPEQWRRILDVNLMGVVHTFTAAARLMVEAGLGGRLVATASVAGLRGEAGGAAYCASKAAVISLCQSLALELAPHGITVNAVAPGEVDTDLHAGLMKQMAGRGGQSAEATRAALLEERVPARRLAAPQEVAAAIAFLVGPSAAYITGETLRVDGGEFLT